MRELRDELQVKREESYSKEEYMRCIFCKKCSDDSISVEHIVPESLGNKITTLPPGVVCDNCNNYFALKVEKKVLESEEFKILRSHQFIKNKKGKYPEINIFVGNERVRAKLTESMNGATFEIHQEDFPRAKKALECKDEKMLGIPISGEEPSNHFMARFLAKMGLELLAKRWVGEEGNSYLVDHEGFDLIRNFARTPKRGQEWVFSKRRIYDQTSNHIEEKKQVIYECDLLLVGDEGGCDIYFVIAYFGMEYAINLGANSIEGYYQWLEENGGVSPLYINAN